MIFQAHLIFMPSYSLTIQGLFKTNEQRITTSRPNQFYTTTNYVYEVDAVSLNLSYTFNAAKNKSKFIDSEFGKREF